MRPGSQVSWGSRYRFPTQLGIASPQSNRQPGLDWSDPSHPLGWLLATLAIAEVMIKANAIYFGTIVGALPSAEVR